MPTRGYLGCFRWNLGSMICHLGYFTCFEKGGYKQFEKKPFPTFVLRFFFAIFGCCQKMQVYLYLALS